MKSFRSWTLYSALVLETIAIVFLIHALKKVDEDRNQLVGKIEVLDQSKGNLQARLTAAEEWVERERQLKDIAGVERAAVNQAPPQTSVGGPTRHTPSEIVSHWSGQMSDGQLGKNIGDHLTAQVHRRYAPLFDRLKLSPSQKDALTQLLVDRKQAASDVVVAMVGDGVDPLENGTAAAGVVADQRSEIETQIQTLLGPQGYQTYLSFERGMGAADVLAQVRASMDYAGMPLSEEQQSKFNNLLQQSRVGHLNTKIVWHAGEFLTPEQHEILRSVYDEQQNNAHVKNRPESVLNKIPAPVSHGG